MKTVAHHIWRVSFCLGLLAFAAVATAAPERPITALGVFSLLGDAIEVVVADAPTDTRLDRAVRNTVDVKDIAFDKIVLRETTEAAKRLLPGVAVSMYSANTSLSMAEQRDIAAGAARGELPAWMVQAVQRGKLSHVLIVTRARTEAGLRTARGTDGVIGRGAVNGLGFYLDTMYNVREQTSGEVGSGAMGPFVIVQFSVMDTDSAEVVRTYTVRDQFLVGPKAGQSVADPWAYLSPIEKAETLRNMLKNNTRRVLPELLGPR
jgi:hypothetical protein